MERTIFVVHIMKTAGTSLRRMFVDALGERAVFPNDSDLTALPGHQYPSPGSLLELVGGKGLRPQTRVIIGHYPAVLASSVADRPFVVAFLREPLARALSMIEHRRTLSPDLAGIPLPELVRGRFGRRQINDYQTKMFAFDHLAECARTVNMPLSIGRARFHRALTRFEAVDFVGIAERFAESIELLGKATGIEFGAERRENRGRERGGQTCSPELLELLEARLKRDRRLYETGLRKFDQQARHLR